jgi:glycerol-3-phosphate dehydrogenase
MNQHGMKLEVDRRKELNEELASITFDLVVIGAGITGCGVARDAAQRGLKVALIDAKDIAYGTSSRSSKLIHGGLRYLELGEFGLVFESVSERAILRKTAPHLVNAQGFLFPIFRHSPVSFWMLKIGLWIYEALSLFRSPKFHKSYSPKKAAAVEPLLSQSELKGVALYWDCTTDDARLTMETALSAREDGAVVGTWRKVTGLKREEGLVCGVEVSDEITGETFEISSSFVVNATGPWTDSVRAMSKESSSLLRPTKGVHLVVDAARLPLEHAVVCTHPDDSRVMFAVPWGERTYIGTTDTDCSDEPGAVKATSEDVDYILRISGTYFPEACLTRRDVIATWAGLRPLVADENAVSESSVSREHQIVVDSSGLITVAGGKLTTYRRMGAEVVEKVIEAYRGRGIASPATEASKTSSTPLLGAKGWPSGDDHQRVANRAVTLSNGAVGDRMARHLVDRYGVCGIEIAASLNSESATPIVQGRLEPWGLVRWAVERELATTLCDFMIRRTQIFFKDYDQGLGVAAKVAAHMGELLGWSQERIEREIETYRSEVAMTRAWRDE